MSTIKDITQWWKRNVSDRIQLTLNMDRVDDWHYDRARLEGSLAIWRCPQGLYEVFVRIPMVGGVHNEYLDDGTDNSLIIQEFDTTPIEPSSAFWYPCEVWIATDHLGNPAYFYQRARQGFIMSSGEILRNNATTDLFRIRYRKLR